MPQQTPATAVRFDDFVLDEAAYELRRHGRSVRIERRPMELLMLLVARRGELVTREEIVDRLWGREVFIDVDASVNTVVRKVADEARVAASRAIEADETVAEAHTAVARVRFLFDWDWRAAEMHLRRAIALNSSSGQSYWMLGHALSHQGRHDEAIAAAARALALDPRDALSHTMSSQIAFSARQPEAAARHAREALAIEPDFWVAHWQLGQAYEQLGQPDPALLALAEASRLTRAVLRNGVPPAPNPPTRRTGSSR